ncbi:hypothetical protein [Sicyoidochytrium minutum DNA virus]|nr:hypothetical protein [Sicyoidochytrium minutum DNA virus]
MSSNIFPISSSDVVDTHRYSFLARHRAKKNLLVLALSESLMRDAAGQVKRGILDGKTSEVVRLPIHIYHAMNKPNEGDGLMRQVAEEACSRAGVKARLAGFAKSRIYLGNHMHVVYDMKFGKDDIERRRLSSLKILVKVIIILRRWQRSKYEPGASGYKRARDSFYNSVNDNKPDSENNDS